MKRQTTGKLIIFMMTFSLLFMLSACSGMNQANKSDDKVILRFSIADAARTVLPEKADLDNLRDIYFYAQSSTRSESTGERYEFSRNYDNMQTLQDSTITLDSSEVNATYYFYISGRLGNVSYSAYIEEYTIRSGENIINFDLKTNSLGHDYGKADITFDLSAAGNYSPVDHAEVFVHRATNYEDIIYSCTLTKESADSSIFRFTAQDIPAGSYRVEVNFYATSSKMALVLSYPFVMQIAENLTSRATLSIDKLNPVYNIEYDMNADGDENIVFDYQANSKISKLSKVSPGEPKREGYVFLGWQMQYSYGWDWYNPNYFDLNSDFTLRAVWESAYTGDDSYLVTKETAQDVISAITEGTKESPAIVRLRGILDLDFYDNVFQAIIANSNVYFELDFSGSLGFNYDNFHNSERLVYECDNLVKIDLSQDFPLEENVFRACSALSNISLTDTGWIKVIDNVLFIGNSLYCYPAGLEAEYYVIPDGTNNIGNFAFSSSSLKTIILPAAEEFNISAGAFNNCPLLESIDVPEDNMRFKSIDGVLYSKDGKTLIKYPAGKNQTSFVVPQNVEGVAHYAFADAVNLQSISFEDSNTIWYTVDSPRDNLFEVLQYYDGVSVIDPSANAQRFVSPDYNSRYYQKVDMEQLLSDSRPLIVYDDVCYDLRDTSYTVSTLSGDNYANRYCLYKVATEKNKSYVVTENETINNSKQFYGFDNNIAKIRCTIINKAGQRLRENYIDDRITFNAETDFTYLLICAESGGGSVSYLRVWKAPEIKKDISLNIQNDNQDIEITVYDSTDQYIRFGIAGFDHYYNLEAVWYVDGNQISSEYTDFSLEKNQYPGIHLITAEIRIQREHNGPFMYYSASKQVVID